MSNCFSSDFNWKNRLSHWFNWSGQWNDCYWPPMPEVKSIKIKEKSFEIPSLNVDTGQWLSDGVSCKPIENKPITSSQEFIDITDKQDELKDLIQSGKDITEEIKALSESIEEGIQKLVDDSVLKFQEASVKDKVKDSNLEKGWYEIVSVKDSNGNKMLPNPKESPVKEESYPELRKVLEEYNERQKAKETRFDKTEGNIISYKTTQEDVEKVIKRMDDFKFSANIIPEKELPPVIITKPKGAHIVIKNINAHNQKIIVQDVEDGTKNPVGPLLDSCVMAGFEYVQVPKQEVEMGLEIPELKPKVTHKEYKTIEDIFEDIEHDFIGDNTDNEDYEEIKRHRSEITSRNERVEELKKSVVQKWLGSGDSDTVKFDKEIEDLSYSYRPASLCPKKEDTDTCDMISKCIDYYNDLALKLCIGSDLMSKYPKSERAQNGGQNNEGDLIDNSTPAHNWISCKDLIPELNHTVEIKFVPHHGINKFYKGYKRHNTDEVWIVFKGKDTRQPTLMSHDHTFWRPLQNESLENCLPENLKFRVGDLVLGVAGKSNDFKIVFLNEIDYTPDFSDKENKSIPFTIDSEFYWFDPRKSFKITLEDLPKIQEILEA